MVFLAIIQNRASHIFVSKTQSDLAIGLCRDARDDMYLALCLAVEADVLVTSDQDLLILNPWNGIHILTPAEFLAEAEASQPRAGGNLS